MHIIKILNNHLMRNPIKSFAKVDQSNNNSMGVLQVKMFMNKLQQMKEIVADGRAFEAKLARIKKRLNYWDKPVSKKRFKHFAQERRL